MILKLIILLSLLFSGSSCSKPIENNIFNTYQNFSVAKFESFNEKDKYIYIDTGFGISFLDYFYGLLFEESDKTVDQWKYRITYDWNQYCSNCEEIEVLMGERCMSVNGVSYEAVSEEYYSRILEQMDYFYEKYADYKVNVE